MFLWFAGDVEYNVSKHAVVSGQFRHRRLEQLHEAYNESSHGPFTLSCQHLFRIWNATNICSSSMCRFSFRVKADQMLSIMEQCNKI